MSAVNGPKQYIEYRPTEAELAVLGDTACTFCQEIIKNTYENQRTVAHERIDNEHLHPIHFECAKLMHINNFNKCWCTVECDPSYLNLIIKPLWRKNLAEMSITRMQQIGLLTVGGAAGLAATLLAETHNVSPLFLCTVGVLTGSLGTFSALACPPDLFQGRERPWDRWVNIATLPLIFSSTMLSVKFFGGLGVYERGLSFAAVPIAGLLVREIPLEQNTQRSIVLLVTIIALSIIASTVAGAPSNEDVLAMFTCGFVISSTACFALSFFNLADNFVK